MGLERRKNGNAEFDDIALEGSRGGKDGRAHVEVFRCF